MQINKIYEAISGEVGMIIPQGSPCLVVRTQGCNLRCSYCDAKETQEFLEGCEADNEDIVSMADSAGLPILLTGGEPLLQEDVADFLMICEEMLVPVQVETNGTQHLIENIGGDLGFVVDYKFGGRFVIDSYSELTNNDVVKFVVKNLPELKKAGEIIKEMDKSCNSTLAISPVVGDKGNISGKDVANYILKNKIPAILNIQLHKIIKMP